MMATRDGAAGRPLKRAFWDLLVLTTFCAALIALHVGDRYAAAKVWLVVLLFGGMFSLRLVVWRLAISRLRRLPEHAGACDVTLSDVVRRVSPTLWQAQSWLPALYGGGAAIMSIRWLSLDTGSAALVMLGVICLAAGADALAELLPWRALL